MSVVKVWAVSLRPSAMRPIRDAIRQRVVDLLASLDVPAGSSA